jgi:hypothetical protein
VPMNLSNASSSGATVSGGRGWEERGRSGQEGCHLMSRQHSICDSTGAAAVLFRPGAMPTLQSTVLTQ